MAGVVTHLAIANMAAKLLQIENIPLYYAGNIAPDCVHSRDNYVREMKRHSHFKDGFPEVDFLRHENIETFHGRLDEFARDYCKKGRDKELYLGYLSHLITDELFIKTIRVECVEKAREHDILQTDKEFLDFMMRELDGGDAIVAEKFEFQNSPVETLRKAYGCSVKNYISAGEIEKSSEWINERFFSGEKNYELPVILKYERIISFIEMAVEEICKRTKIL